MIIPSIGGFQTKKCLGEHGEPSWSAASTQTSSCALIGHKALKCSSGCVIVAEHAMKSGSGDVVLLVDPDDATRHILLRRCVMQIFDEMRTVDLANKH
jgi:hypothetical protein